MKKLLLSAALLMGAVSMQAQILTEVEENTYAITATLEDLKAAYDTKNGTPTAAAPMVFFKWSYVNTVTGEKSDEIMGYAKLAE